MFLLISDDYCNNEANIYVGSTSTLSTKMTPVNRKMQMVMLYFILFLLDVVVTKDKDRVYDNNRQSRRKARTRQKLLIIVIDG